MVNQYCRGSLEAQRERLYHYGKKVNRCVKGITVIDGKHVVSKQYKGKKIFKRLGTVDEMSLDEDKTYLTEQMHLMDHPPAEDAFPASGSLTIRNALDYFWENHLLYKSYAKDIRHQLTRLSERLGHKFVLKVRKSDIEMYKRERSKDKVKNGKDREKTISKRTLQSELNYLAQAYNLLVDDGLIERNHIKGFTYIKLDKSDP